MKTLTIKDLPLTARELEEKEMAHISGGMTNIGDHPMPTEPSTEWVPKGIVKDVFCGTPIPRYVPIPIEFPISYGAGQPRVIGL